MKKQFSAALLIIISPILFVSCVSTLLKEKAPTFSTEVSYMAPTTPFISSNKSVFPSWKNKTTGNVLSIVSDCQPGNPITLAELQRMIEDSVENPNSIKETFITFQNRPALQRTLRGDLDQTPIEVHSMAFKRLNCGYVVSLSGHPDQVQQDQKSFDQFLQSLKFK